MQVLANFCTSTIAQHLILWKVEVISSAPMSGNFSFPKWKYDIACLCVSIILIFYYCVSFYCGIIRLSQSLDLPNPKCLVTYSACFSHGNVCQSVIT